MKTLEPPTMEPRHTPPADDGAQVIDTSKMNAGQRAALEMTESARDAASEKGSFAANLFMGRYELDRLLPYPMQSHEDRDQGDAFLARLDAFLRAKAFCSKTCGSTAVSATQVRAEDENFVGLEMRDHADYRCLAMPRHSAGAPPH